jgi:hypothetical protein
MKRTFLSKLHRNGLYCITGALLLLLGVPLYQFLIFILSGNGNALANPGLALHWINDHILLFLGYRVLLVVGFALMISLPFTLFRIIVAQEILGREEDEQEEHQKEDEQEEKHDETDEHQADAMPAFAWRGKGYAVLAAWAGLMGLLFFVGGTLASSLYLVSSAASLPSHATNLDTVTPLAGIFAIITFTVGGGLLAFSCLLFGAVIARSGLNLWPGRWVAFGYMALGLSIFFSVSAVDVAFAPGAGQTLLSTLAVLFFTIWVLWFGIMLVRLKPE